MSYEEQIMSKDKYPNIFSPQMEAIVFIILQIFFATRAVNLYLPTFLRYKREIFILGVLGFFEDDTIISEDS